MRQIEIERICIPGGWVSWHAQAPHLIALPRNAPRNSREREIHARMHSAIVGAPIAYVGYGSTVCANLNFRVSFEEELSIPVGETENTEFSPDGLVYAERYPSASALNEVRDLSRPETLAQMDEELMPPRRITEEELVFPVTKRAALLELMRHFNTSRLSYVFDPEEGTFDITLPSAETGVIEDSSGLLQEIAMILSI